MFFVNSFVSSYPVCHTPGVCSVEVVKRRDTSSTFEWDRKETRVELKKKRQGKGKREKERKRKEEKRGDRWFAR